MTKDRIQTSRFEQKYIISEENALEIHDYVGSWLELDENALGKPNYSYPVHSLYLDSDDLKLHWSTIKGDKNRFKLRLRFYDDNPNAPVFFEIKQRINKCLVKKRAPVRRDAVDRLLAGDTLQQSHLISQHPESMSALQEFCERMYELDARPKVHVGYFREAYMPHNDNSARLTMDRAVRAEPTWPVSALSPLPRGEDQGKGQTGFSSLLSTTILDPVLVWGNDVVLELKFTNRFPDRFRDLVSTFGLRQCGASKYVDSVATLGDKLRPPDTS